MQLRVKLIDISTGDSPVVLMTVKAALTHDLHTGDRIQLSANNRQSIAVVNTTNKSFGITDDQVGMFLEPAVELSVAEGNVVTITPVPKPDSIQFIKEKMSGAQLNDAQMHEIIKDIVSRSLTNVELTFFVAACSIQPLSFGEILALTRAMADTGQRLTFDKPLVIDKHCIGGVPGNRTSMITVPIMASLGYIVPKTSSRAITSPAGTADTMEVLAEVNMTADRMKQIVDTVGACIVWGGAVNLAPADDHIIRVERPLSIDVDGLMIASVMAKKLSAGSTHVVIDIPYGPGAKVLTLERARELQQRFIQVGKHLGLRVLVTTTDGSQPIGNGVGPVLEAYDVLAVLKNEKTAPVDLRDKSLMLAGKLLEWVGHCEHGKGVRVAENELTSGRAFKKFQEIIDAQGRKEVPPLAKFTYDVFASASGTISSIDNLRVAKIARLAGAPISKGAGLLLYAKVGTAVSPNDKLYTIFAESNEKLANAVSFAKTNNPYGQK